MREISTDCRKFKFKLGADCGVYMHVAVHSEGLLWMRVDGATYKLNQRSGKFALNTVYHESVYHTLLVLVGLSIFLFSYEPSSH